MSLVLRSGSLHKEYLYKPLITAAYCGVMVECVDSPGKVWVLQTPEGPVIDSNTMARYIAKLKGDDILYGSSLFEFAQVEEWMEFASMEIEDGIRRWIFPMKGLGPCDPGHSMIIRIARLKHSLRVLNKQLAVNNYYLVGNRISLADIAMTCALHFGFTYAMTEDFTSEFPNVVQYFWYHVGQPNFKKILGEVKQAESLPPEWPLVLPVMDMMFVDPQTAEAWRTSREPRKVVRHNEMVGSGDLSFK